MSYQVKVEYSEDKWISFFVDMSDVHCGSYMFIDLVTDITGRCPSLSHLTSTTIRIRYCDDEGNYVNINYGDEKGYREMWNNAVSLNDREYKRLKLKAGELNSPYTYATTKSRINGHQTDIKEIDTVRFLLRKIPPISHESFWKNAARQ